MSTHQDTAMTPFQPLYTPGPVFYSSELGGWQVPNYQDIVKALHLQNDGSIGREGAYGESIETNPLLCGMWLRDEPAHTDLREMVKLDFRSEAITSMKASLAEKAHELLSWTQKEPAGQIELVEEYAVPLTRYAICDLLVGVSSQEDWLRTWQNAHPSVSPLNETDFLPALKAWLERGEQRPGGVLDKLLALYHQGASIAGSPMSLDELMSFFDMFAMGGYESLRTNVATALLTLIEQGALEVLHGYRDRPEFPALLSSAREEVLRYAPSYPCVPLKTRTEVTLNGQTIPPEATLIIWVSAANRDPAVYKDPDRFDVWRYFDLHQAPKPPLTFGYGMHYCLGAEISRVLISTAIEAFVDLVPVPVRLDPQESPTYYPYYGLDHSIKQAYVVYGRQEAVR